MYLEKIDITDQLPRAHGALRLKSAGKSKIRSLFQQGSTKALFPRKVNGLECVVINTSGGLTGGDKFSNIIECEDQSKLTLTTQGCERIYKSNDGAQEKQSCKCDSVGIHEFVLICIITSNVCQIH